MAFIPETAEPKRQRPSTTRNKKKKPKPKSKWKQTSSWGQIKSLLTCKQIEGSRVHDPSISKPSAVGYPKLGPCSSLCSFRDVVHGNSKVVHIADHHNSPHDTTKLGRDNRVMTGKPVNGSSSSRSFSTSVRPDSGHSSSSRGLQLRKLYGCYECHMIVDPTRYASPRTTVCACSECGEVFPKIESLELHQAVKHAVSELSPDDSSRNVVEIIFKSSWLKKDNPICKIERILKVHNTRRTIQRFEDCRNAVKIRAITNTKKNPRCAADGNELLRFHCTTLACALGARGSSSLCGCVPSCGVCTVIRHGFQGIQGKGSVRTMASSGKAHDCLDGPNQGRRAMLVCRVIAGRVSRMADDEQPEEDSNLVGSYDSEAGHDGSYSNLEELFVSNPRAILPCFVVIYKALTS